MTLKVTTMLLTLMTTSSALARMPRAYFFPDSIQALELDSESLNHPYYKSECFMTAEILASPDFVRKYRSHKHDYVGDIVGVYVVDGSCDFKKLSGHSPIRWSEISHVGSDKKARLSFLKFRRFELHIKGGARPLLALNSLPIIADAIVCRASNGSTVREVSAPYLGYNSIPLDERFRLTVLSEAESTELRITDAKTLGELYELMAPLPLTQHETSFDFAEWHVECTKTN